MRLERWPKIRSRILMQNIRHSDFILRAKGIFQRISRKQSSDVECFVCKMGSSTTETMGYRKTRGKAVTPIMRQGCLGFE